jgi:glycerophosphoryl diester phosphodiesterase
MLRFFAIPLLFAAMNLSAQTPFDWQAHRGGRGIMPENSLPAFRKSLEIREIATLELDVVVSKDRQVVVSHEPFFSADFCLAPGGKEIAKGDEKKHNLYQLTYAEIKQYDCGSKGNKAYPEQQKMPVAKPLLSEVLQMAEQYCRDNNRPPVHYNIEIKSTPDGDGSYHPNVTEFSTLVYEVIKQHVPLNRVVLQSFDFRVLKHWHTQYPEVALSALVANVKSAEKNVEELGFTPAIYSPYFKMISDKNAVDKIHGLGMKLVPWTVNDIADMRRLKEWGVDGIITDYPNRIAEIR